MNILSNKQYENVVVNWMIDENHDDFINRQTYIKNMIKKDISNFGYPPVNDEDKNNPDMWRPPHWTWFLKSYFPDIIENIYAELESEK